MFENYDIDTLYKLLKFSFSNQINLLLNTIGYVIASKQKIIQHNDKYYLIDKQIIANDCLTEQQKTIEIPFVYMNFIKSFYICSSNYLLDNQIKQIKKYTYEYNPELMHLLQIPNLELKDIQFVNNPKCKISKGYFLVIANEINNFDKLEQTNEYTLPEINLENFINVYHHTKKQK